MQAQIQALLATGGERGRTQGADTEIAKPQVSNGTSSQVSGFVTTCKLYLRMKIRGVVIEEQIQWMLSYIQGESANVWKENILEDLEGGVLEYEMVGEFLADIKKEFGGRDEKTIKVAELKRLEQRKRIIEDFFQEFRKAARGSRYEGRPLVEEFKKEMNRTIC